MNVYQWEQLKAKDKNKLSELKPILILGPRAVSLKRIQELTEKIIEKRPVLWGCLTDKYIPGLEGSVQFKSLKLSELQAALKKLDKFKNSINILEYHQRYTKYVLRELDLSAVIGIYGSWHKAFHFTPIYYELSKKDLNYKLVSGFVDEQAAQNYYQEIEPKLPSLKEKIGKSFSDQELMNLAGKIAKRSFDYTFQTGAVLARDGKLLAGAHNRVLPYPTYTLHQGASKEKHFSPPHDLNHFDTNHAEVELLLTALKAGADLEGASLYINLLPCPICARMIARSTIKEVVYQHDHSQGYGFKLLKKVGKKVSRLII